MKVIIAVVFALLFNGSLLAQATWNIDKTHSTVGFTVKHMLITDVEGNFKDYEVTAKTNAKNKLESISATIKTGSINTENEKRDQHLKSDDFFNSENFPEMTFVSSKIEAKKGNQFKIHGNLTIRGITKAVVLDATFNGEITDPWGNTRMGWNATTTINRFDYDLKWNTLMEAGGAVVSKDVKVILNVQFIKAK